MSNKEFHIAFLLATFSVGGAQSVMVNLANNMANKGIKVDFIIADCSGPFLNQVDSKVNIIDLKTKKMSRSLFSLIKLLKKTNPDVLLCTQKHTNIIACISKFFLGSSPKIVVRESSTPSVEYKISSNKEKIIYRIAQLFYPVADFFIGQSSGLTKDCISFYGIPSQKIKTIPNPIISNKMFKRAEEACEHPWIKEDIPILMTMGRGCLAKDFTTLVKAFSIVRKEKVCRLMILGNMQEEEGLFEDLQQLITELRLDKDICFLGFKKNPFSYLRNAKVYVLSSVYEGLPGALIQAMALGCNVVSTDCPYGPREIIERGESGILVPVKDYRGLAKGILYHLDNPQVPKYDLRVFEEAYSTQEYLTIFKRICKKEEQEQDSLAVR